MSEEYTCIECENLYDDTDGDTDERMCNKCLDKIYFEELKIKSKKQVKLAMIKVDKFIDWVKGEQRDPNIQRSSTVHYPDWDKKKKVYIVPPNKRKINKTLNAIKSTPEYKLGKKLLDGEISNVTIDSIIDKESGVE